jgi:uncharacterized membrane protein YqhA
MLKTVLEKSRYLILIAVLFTLIASLAAFLLGATKTVAVIYHVASTRGEDPKGAIELIRIIDIFLISAAFFIFAVGMYELFIEDVSMPAWLIIHNLHDLKAKLGSVVVLVLAVTFLEHVVEWKDPQGTLYFGIAIALVSASLIAFGYFGEKD